MSQRRTSQGSLFAAVADGVASQEDSSRLQRLEIGLGFLGFFTLVALASTIAATVGGKPAVVEAVISALFVFLLAAVFGRWQKVGQRVAADAARRSRPATADRIDRRDTAI